MKKNNLMFRMLSWLLITVITTTQLPLEAVAAALEQRDFRFGQQAAEVRGGVFSAADGSEYAVLYNDYITLYVNTLDGGFAVLPATEKFDESKPLSYTSFQIDSETYRYGTYYDGVSGAVSIAPQVNEESILESHWQIGDFVISQIFAITSDTLHDNSYAVKIGYAAQYFGQGSSPIAGRIMLDTQFTPDESVPVMLVDSADNLALVDSEAAVRPAPAVAFISKEFIAEANLEVEADIGGNTAVTSGPAVKVTTPPVIYQDLPSKGFIVFDDKNFSSPDSVMFADFDRARGTNFEYTPDWDKKLFDGSGADSGLLLYWDEVSVESGNQVAFGTNYGFYDLERGNPRFDSPPKQANALAALAEAETATVNIENIDQYIPEDWFDIKASSAFSKEKDQWGNGFMRGEITKGVPFQIFFDYKPGTPQIIKDAVTEYNIWINWDEGNELDAIEETLNVGEYYELDTNVFFSKRGMVDVYDEEWNVVGEAPANLRVMITPVFEAPEDYAILSIGLSGPDGAALSMVGVGSDADKVIFYGNVDSAIGGDLYIVKQNAKVTLTAEMKSLQYKLSDGIHESDLNPQITWYDKYPPATMPTYAELPPEAGDLKGPLTYTYTFTVPDNAKSGSITVGVTDSGDIAPRPVNVKAYHASHDPYSPGLIAIENALWNAIGGDGVTRDQGVIWSSPSKMVTIAPSVLSSYGGTIKAYKVGTKTEAATIIGNSFTMPNEPVDLVYENGAVYRVFTKVTSDDGDGSASVTVNSSRGSTPEIASLVHIYVTNIKEGYEIDSVTASGGITPIAQAGGYWTFNMPSSDVTVTVALKSIPIPTYRSVTVKPLVGDGSTLYDVMFWTDNVVEGRKVHQVDAAGRSGQVPVKAKVYYALFPTSWNTDPGTLGDMSQWVVTGFTVDGKTPAGFEGINTESKSGIGYFPYTYNPNSSLATAGYFTMPDHDVEFEITGYKKDFKYSLGLEAYDQYGNRLEWAEGNISSAPASNGVRDWVQQPDGTKVSSVKGIGQFPVNMQTAVMIQRSIYDYTLNKVEMVINPGNKEWERIIPEAKRDTNGNFATYYFNATWPYSGVVRVYYTNTARTLNITGAEMDGDNVLSQGEVMVAAGDSFGLAGSDTRRIEIAPVGGVYETLVTLTWSEYVSGRSSYTIHSLPTGSQSNCNVQLVRSGSEGSGSFAVYKVTLTGDASIAIQSSETARDISFSDYFSANSPNSGTFRTATLTAGKHTGRLSVGGEFVEGYWVDKIKEILNAGAPPKITKMAISGEKGYSKQATDGDIFNNAGYKPSFTFSDDGQYMTLDLRTLFGISEDYVFEEDRYTLTIDYTYGDGYKQKGSKSYKFDLSPNSFSPGELTHIAIVKAERYNAPWRQERPDVAINSWVAVPGVDYEDMAKKALVYDESGHFLYFVCEEGFEPGGKLISADGYAGTHQFLAEDKTVLLNGHGKYSPLFSDKAFMIDEDGQGNVTIVSNGMSFTSSYLPLFVPAGVGARALELRLEKNKYYDVPQGLPSYDEIRKQHATNEEAKEAWMEAVEEARESMLALSVVYPNPVWKGAADEDQAFLGAELGGNGLSVSIAGFEGGATIDVKDIFLLKGGFEVGGRLNVQIPGTTKPILRLEVLSLATESGDKFMPVGDIWAEGEGMVQLPDALGGYGGSAFGVFNTYTDQYGFEGEINFYLIELSGSFYLAKTSYGFPMLDEFIVSVGVNDLPVGLGFPPAPAQIIEIQGITVGVTKLADTVSYNPLKNTIPSVRIILGAQFALAEIIGFGGEMWLELLSGGISVSGGVGIGPVGLDLIKELSLSYGVRDGVYTPYGNTDDYIIKGKRSLTFFFNFKFHASLFFADGAGAFGISLNISPALWEKRGGFQNLSELAEFVNLNLSASGWMCLSVLQLSDDWSLYNAEISVDISFKTGKDFRVMPFGFKTFEFIAKEKVMGFDVGESRVNVLAYYNYLETWLVNKLKEKKARLEQQRGGTLSIAETAQLQTMLLSEALAEPQRFGLNPNAEYQGEYTSFIENVATDSESRAVLPVPMSGIAPMSIIQDLVNIKVDYDGLVYTHSVTVPNNGSRYILRLEGYGGESLSLSDIQAFKPNGQALTISGAQGGTAAALAESAYNAVIRDGQMLLSLANYRGTDDANTPEVTGVDGTLPGVWQIVSSRPFKSELIKISAPRVKSVELKADGTLTAEFENITDTAGGDYYYALTLEHKGDPSSEPQETVTLLKDKRVQSGDSVTLNLKAMPNLANTNDASLQYDVNDILASGDWYARVTLRQGKNESTTVVDEKGATQTVTALNTRYVDDKISVSPYKIINTLLKNERWTASLTAASGGNQSIDVSFAPATAVSDELTVTGYHIAVYDTNNMPASRVTTTTDNNGNGVQRVEPMEFDFIAGELAQGKTRYSYNIPNVPVGRYTVGVSPLYADLIPKTDDKGNVISGEYTASATTRKGKEEKSSEVSIAQANPPSLSLAVTGGNLTERNGAKIIFAGPDAALTATASGGAGVKFYQYDGTPITVTDAGILTELASYSGQMLMITATNANGDFTAAYVTVYANVSAPILLPDNYDTVSGNFVFTAYKNTGRYTLTGQTDPGAMVGGVAADASGRFKLSGALKAGADTDIVALAVSNEAGMVTMREVSIVRGTQNEPVNPPSGGGDAGDSSGGSSGRLSGGSSGRSSGGSSQRNFVIPAGDGTASVSYTKSGGTVMLSLPDSKINEIINKSKNGTAIFDLAEIFDATDVVLPKTALMKLAEAGLDVEFRLPGGTVRLDADAAASAAAQANGANIAISLTAVSRSSLTEAQRTAIDPGDLVIDISVFSGTQQIHNFDGSITISVPYSGTIPVAVWYLNDAGELEKVDCIYDATAKTVAFTVNHLSLYVIRADRAVLEPWVNPFADVKDSDWFYKYVEYVFTRGLMTGTSTNPMLFSPNMTTTRGMIVSVLYRHAGSPDVSGLTNPFSDVDEGKWYTSAAKWAAANGIVAGYGNGKFGPEDNVSRQDLAVILNNFARQNGWPLPVTRGYPDFNDDADIANYAKEAIEAFFKANVINGKPGNIFDPKGEATRAELATMLTRFLEAVKEK